MEGDLGRGRRKNERLSRAVGVKKHQMKEKDDPQNREGKDEVQAKETGKGSISNGKATSDSVCDILTNKGDCSYKASNYSSTSEAHLSSGKDVTDECGRHH